MKLRFLVLFNFLFLCAQAKDDIAKSIYDYKLKAQNGSTIDLSQYRGKKIMIVNTPVNDETARQYFELDAVYQKYKDKLVIIAVLADDFQIAPGSKKNPPPIDRTYAVSYPLAAKLGVRVNDMSDLYKWLTDKNYNSLKDNDVQWDFQKYLINEKGQLIDVFLSKVKPSSPEVIAEIEK